MVVVEVAAEDDVIAAWEEVMLAVDVREAAVVVVVRLAVGVVVGGAVVVVPGSKLLRVSRRRVAPICCRAAIGEPWMREEREDRQRHSANGVDRGQKIKTRDRRSGGARCWASTGGPRQDGEGQYRARRHLGIKRQ